MTATTTTQRTEPKLDPRYHLSRREYERLMRQIPRGPHGQ
ncbi:hypothetical protein SSP35_03_03240 [Streptomyces sp. NBRC 110611]|nr:hypothetical protein SSP35_03_03240 [Streptomyces sp. NBRC 110611]